MKEYGPMPPPIRTFPFVSSVAVCPRHGVDMSPVDVNVPGDVP